MKLGTAQITEDSRGIHTVIWMNHGSFLQNEPRRFGSEHEAREFCRERGLRIVSFTASVEL